MVVDNELVPQSGLELVQNNARIPLLTGAARREWAHKKGSDFSLIKLQRVISAEFYQYMHFENVSKQQIADSVRKIVESAYVASIPIKLTNSTIDLIANATYQRYMNDVNFSYEMPEVVYRLQDVNLF